jgi:hypothetical protein
MLRKAQGWQVAERSIFYCNRHASIFWDQLIYFELFLDPVLFSGYIMPSNWGDRNEWVNPENSTCGGYFTNEYEAGKTINNIYLFKTTGRTF